jgi:hypothetical protein
MGGTAATDPAGHADQASHCVTTSEETTMRQALVVTQLINEARSAPAAAKRQLADAPPDPEAPAGTGNQIHRTSNRSHRTDNRFRRLTTLFRRARVRAPGLGAESPGGGA